MVMVMSWNCLLWRFVISFFGAELSLNLISTGWSLWTLSPALLDSIWYSDTSFFVGQIQIPTSWVEYVDGGWCWGGGGRGRGGGQEGRCHRENRGSFILWRWRCWRWTRKWSWLRTVVIILDPGAAHLHDRIVPMSWSWRSAQEHLRSLSRLSSRPLPVFALARPRVGGVGGAWTQLWVARRDFQSLPVWVCSRSTSSPAVSRLRASAFPWKGREWRQRVSWRWKVWSRVSEGRWTLEERWLF